MLSLLIACVPSDGTETADTGPDPSAYLAGTAPLAAVSDGACPDLDDGNVDLVSAGLDRTVKILLPESGGEGKPVVFAWYPLGGSAQWLVSALDLRGFADAVDAIVVVPSAADGAAFEWAFADAAEGNEDLVLYDDVRACLYEQYAVDLGRVSSMGFSAGALWTSYLSVHRGDTLSAILPFSGGADPVVAYETPAGPFAALLPFGGPNDLYGGGVVDFAETTGNFADDLAADGHFVVVCDHGGGHTIPAEGRDMMDAWLVAHTYGEPSPFVGDISAFPDYCAIHTP